MYETHRGGISMQQAGHSLAARTEFRSGEERESPPRRFFPGLSGRWLARPFARARRTPAVPAPSQPVQIIRSLSIQFSSIHSAGRTYGRGRRRNDGRTRGRTRLAGKLCDTWWNRCNTLFVPRFWGISSLLVLSDLLQRNEVSSGLKFILVLFCTT